MEPQMGLESAKKALSVKATLSSYQEQEHSILAPFASAEHLAHTVAYDLAANYDPALPLVVIDEDGKSREYKATPIETANPAILGYILTGTDNTNNRIHVVFRGTADKASIVRDTEYGGAGHESFNAEKDLIISQITRVIGQRANETDNKVQVSISGHSLGGGDAQNCSAALLEAMTQIQMHKRYQEKNQVGKITDQIKSALTMRPSGALTKSAHAPLTQVASVTLNHCNSAGVTHTTANKSRKNAKYLSKLGVAIKVRALKVAGDGIQMSGQTNILNDVEPETADVAVLKINSSHEGWISAKTMTAATGLAYVTSPAIAAGTITSLKAIGTFKAHTTHNFDRFLTNNDYEYFDNSNSAGALAVKKALSHKSLIDNNIVSHSLKKIVHTLTNPFVRQRKIAPHVLLQYEMFKSSSSDFSYDEELFDALILENTERLKLKI